MLRRDMHVPRADIDDQRMWLPALSFVEGAAFGDCANSFFRRWWGDLATEPLGENFTNEPFNFGSFQPPRLLCNHQEFLPKAGVIMHNRSIDVKLFHAVSRKFRSIAIFSGLTAISGLSRIEHFMRFVLSEKRRSPLIVNIFWAIADHLPRYSQVEVQVS
jgi:hypothetical protein